MFCLSVCLCTMGAMLRGARRGHEKHSMWVLGTELRFSARTVIESPLQPPTKAFLSVQCPVSLKDDCSRDRQRPAEALT